MVKGAREMTQQQLEKEVTQMFTQDKYTTVKETRVKEAIHDHGNYIKKLNSCVERGVWGK